MKKNGNLILRNSFATIAILIALLMGGYFLLVTVYPGSLASFYQNINKNASLKYYERAYLKNKNINNLYMLVDKAIEFERDNVLIKYFPELLNSENYLDFIIEVNAHNYNEENDVSVNLFMLNEDNRLKTRYVKALVKTDAKKAFDFAFADLDGGAEVIGLDNVNFVCSGLVNNITDVKEYFTGEEIDTLSNFYTLIKQAKEQNTNYSNLKQANYTYKTLEVCRFLILLSENEVGSFDRQALLLESEALFTELNTLLGG